MSCINPGHHTIDAKSKENSKSLLYNLESKIGKFASTSVPVEDTENANNINLGGVHSSTCSNATKNGTEKITTDNKAVVDAMLKSCSEIAKRRTASKDHSDNSLIGSIIGGDSLQRSDSVDGSEITIFDYGSTFHPSIGERQRHSFPNGAIPNEWGHTDPHHEVASALYTNTAVPYPVHTAFLLPLPAGWKMRMSKTKNKPYYVHPDFGSTWYYPGLLPPSSVAFPTHQIVPTTTESQIIFHGLNAQQPVIPDAKIRSASVPESGNKLSVNSSEMASNGSVKKEGLVEIGVEKPSFEVSASKGQILSHAEIESGCMSQASWTLGGDAAVENTNVDETKYDEHFLVQDDSKDMDSCSNLPLQGLDNDYIEFVCNGGLENADEQVLDGEASSTVSSCVIPSGSVDIEETKETNSMESDHVDVDALLRQKLKKSSTPLPTIEEINDESVLSAGESSSASSSHHRHDPMRSTSPFSAIKDIPDESALSSRDSRSEPKSTSKPSLTRDRLFDELSRASETNTKAIVDVQNAVTDEFSFASNTGDSEDHQSPIFNGGLSDSGSERESQGPDESPQKNTTVSRKLGWQLDREKEVITARGHQHKRKLFPPGPLCSLQFLDLIVDGSMDTPLWRNCKRKRSSLTSIKRGQRNSF